jgi:hypothetical protein
MQFEIKAMILLQNDFWIRVFIYCLVIHFYYDVKPAQNIKYSFSSHFRIHHLRHPHNYHIPCRSFFLLSIPAESYPKTYRKRPYRIASR